MPADEAPKGAEAVSTKIEVRWPHPNAVWSEDGELAMADDVPDEFVIRAALRADPLRAYIREQTERVPCSECEGTGGSLGTPYPLCSRCDGDGTLPRYQAEGGAAAFIAGLGARL